VAALGAARGKPVPPWRSLRQHVFAWLCPLAPAVPEFRESAVACGEHPRRLLVEPEMRTLLMLSPSVGNSSRSMCWMLGVETSLLYPEPMVAAASADVPEQNDVPAAAMPPASTLARAMSPSRDSRAARTPAHVFARG
jgi:hypothetical protein